MRIKIDHHGKLTVTERRTTASGTCYDEEIDVGIIREPVIGSDPQYNCWRVYFYMGAHCGGEFSVDGKDEAISKLLRAYLYPIERLF
jgi:hypothetical protein